MYNHKYINNKYNERKLILPVKKYDGKKKQCPDKKN